MPQIWFPSFMAVRPWFDDKLDNAPTSLVLNYCFIWRKKLKIC